MSKKKLAPIEITKPQSDWLEAEKSRTGNTTATLIRTLIQEKIDKKESAK
jgi:hypothetical protein